MKNNKNAFTLIEVIAVISILSLVFIVAIPKVNDYIKSRKNDTFITNARNISRQLAYDNLEYKTFEKTTLEDMNIKGISKDDFDLSSSVAYVIEDKIYIDLVGKGKYKDMYICGANHDKKDITIQNEQCNTNIGEFVYIDFDVNLVGGSTSQQFESKYLSGKYIVLEPPTKEGYVFKGWYVERGNSIIEGNRIKIGTEDTVITALWVTKTMLTIDLDGGSVSISQSKTYDSGTIVELKAPTKEGYTFTGWKLVSGNSVLSGNNLTIGTEDTVIRATYRLNTSNLIIDLDGGSVLEKQDGDYKPGDIIELNVPTKEGYTFTGWKLVSGNGVLSGNNLTIGEKDTTINALYKGNKYVVTFNANGGGVVDYSLPTEYMFTPSHNGEYKLEVWGAQGGSGKSGGTLGGYGSYSSGVVYLEKGESIYINVGGQGITSSSIDAGVTTSGGYNGGGSGSSTGGKYGSSGGGATHIAKMPGLLSSLSNNINDILIVAGGGGSGFSHGNSSLDTVGGSGGGYKGNGNVPGTQTSGGGSFGQGQNSTSGSGGGGGFYGGGNCTDNTSCGGGSGYIGNSLLTNKVMYCYNCNESSEISTKTISTTNVSSNAESYKVKSGEGFARIVIPDVEQNVTFNLPYGELPVIERKGYIFLGWYTEATGGETITEDSIVNISNNHELYAHWQEESPIEFSYKGQTQEFVVPNSGYYHLEVWGAQGGSGKSGGTLGGYGSYSSGVVYLEKDETLYINVGGQGNTSSSISAGVTTSGGYNGGGSGYSTGGKYGSGGGGATHIAKIPGLLSNLSNNINDILIVAGGGGSGFSHGNSSLDTIGGSGGGYKGNGNVPGTQTLGGGSFGQGQNNLSNGSGGGGGFYGGGNCTDNTSCGGGSGYIGNSQLIGTQFRSKTMCCYNCDESEAYSTKTVSTTNVSETPTSSYAKIGNGYARIKYIGKEVEVKNLK